MSRLDPKVQEENRVAWNKAVAAEKHAEKVAAWLAANPDIGITSGGYYYKVVDGKAVEVEEFHDVFYDYCKTNWG